MFVEKKIGIQTIPYYRLKKLRANECADFKSVNGIVNKKGMVIHASTTQSF